MLVLLLAGIRTGHHDDAAHVIAVRRQRRCTAVTMSGASLSSNATHEPHDARPIDLSPQALQAAQRELLGYAIGSGDAQLWRTLLSM